MPDQPHQPRFTVGPALTQALRGFTLLVTNLIKLGGLGVAINEAFNRATPRTGDILLAAFMMAGAQLSEQQILNLVGRLFGVGGHGGHPEPAETAPSENGSHS